MSVRIDLTPAHRIEAWRRRRRARRWVAVCSLYALMLAGLWASVHLAWGGPASALADNLADVRDQIEMTQDGMDRLAPRLAEARATFAANQSIGRQPNWSALLDLLAAQLGEDVVLALVTLEPIGADEGPAALYRLRLSGFGRSQAAVSDYTLRLEQTMLFDGVRLQATRREPFRAGHAVAFEAECLLGRLADATGKGESSR